jgi:predicted permease
MSWLTRLRNALNPRRLDEELAEELRDHLERRAAELEGQGWSAGEARRQANLTFGNVTGIRESSRELRLWAGLEGTCQDVRYAWRGLRRTPIFAAAAVVSLGLAIGANTAIYSIVDAALLRPLPVANPDGLFTLATAENGDDELFSFPLGEELRVAAGGAARLALFGSPSRVEAQATDEGAAYEDVIQQYVSPDSFDVLGVSPASGRLLSAGEPRATAVLSYEYWRRRFGGDAAVVGRRLTVDGRTYSIAGVAREGFRGTEPGKYVDVWLPVTLMDPSIFTNPDIRLFHIMGRLAPGSRKEQLTARLQGTFQRHQAARAGLGNGMPEAMQKHLREMRLRLNSGANGISAFRRSFARPLWILLLVSGCILLIACANVASLLLARSSARTAEMALRVSLGARRSRLVRQLLTESLVISLLAGICGWLMACAAAPALVAMVSTPANPIRLDLALDTRVLGFCAAICACSALFFGLLPAWQATSASPIFALRHMGAQAGRMRLGRVFVGVQVAFAFCLVTGGSGFVLSLHKLGAVDAGFEPRGVTVLTISNTAQRDRQLALLQQLQQRTAALPNVNGAATGWTTILSGTQRAQRVMLPGRAASEHAETFSRVSPGYFAALRTPLLEGRDFTLGDNDNEPVPTIVNRAFAKRYFGAGSPLGREFRRDDGVRHQVIGLAADSHLGDLRSGPEAVAYMPMKPPRAYTLYVRSTLDAGSVAKMVEREAETLGAGVRVRDVTTMEALMERTMLKERLLAGIGGSFAFLGLALAAAGLFGLLNYSVTMRTHEIGIRSALGAQRLPIYRLVMRDLTGMAAGGLMAGVAGSLALMRLTQSLMFGIGVADPTVMGTAAAVFLGTALFAGWLPARRAAAIDPVIALRHQ